MGDFLYLLNLWILLFLQIGIDGCVRNVPTDLPQPKQKSDNGYKVVPENHRLLCTTNETLAKLCLNGGTCFASQIATNVRQISCQCPDKYAGHRCQMIDTTIIFERKPKKSLSTVSLVAIPIFGVLGLIVFIILIFRCIKWNKNDQRATP